MSLLDYIDASPSPYHAVLKTVDALEAKGFSRVGEADGWNLSPGRKYYTIRGGRTLIAWTMGLKPPHKSGVRILGAHTDSPVLKIRPNPSLDHRDMSLLTTEIYGGPLLYTWLDRDLKLSGAVYAKGKNSVKMHPFDLKDIKLRASSLAIHLHTDKRSDGISIDRQKDLPVLLSGPGTNSKEALYALLGEAVGVSPTDILDADLHLADTQPCSFIGDDNQFIAAPRLDNLMSCYTALKALLSADINEDTTNIIALYDAEEIGSQTWTGAKSDPFTSTLTRICHAYDLTTDEAAQTRARSIFISADTAHAEHVSFKSATDPDHVPKLNGGLAVKSAARGNYAIGYPAMAWFKMICADAGVPLQNFMYRCDHGAGSSVGPLVTTGAGICGIDVGAPILSMHSIREIGGAKDVALTTDAFRAFFAAKAAFVGSD